MLSQEAMMELIRKANTHASANSFVGAFLNFFYKGPGGPDTRYGTVLLKSPLAELKDVPINDLNNPNLNDLGSRFRETFDYAKKQGYAAGFPNFFHADHGNGIVCGTILLKSDAIEWRDVPISELNNIDLNDLDGRFRETFTYATKQGLAVERHGARHGFIGGFPNFFSANYGNGIVCGTVLLKSNVAEWQDVYLFGHLT